MNEIIKKINIKRHKENIFDEFSSTYWQLISVDLSLKPETVNLMKKEIEKLKKEVGKRFTPNGINWKIIEREYRWYIDFVDMSIDKNKYLGFADCWRSSS